MSMDQDQQREEKIREAIEMLSGYFDTVYIGASRYDVINGVTVVYDNTVGCGFSIYGQLKSRIALAENMDDHYISGPSDEDEEEIEKN